VSSIHLRRAVAVVTGAMLAAMLIGPASAAIPKLVPSFEVLSPAVKNGDIAGFKASIFNNDTSTVSQLFLIDTGSGGTFDTASPSQGKCNATGPLYCTLGQLKPGKTATVIFTLRAPIAGATLPVSVQFNTTGLGSGGGDNSHGDAWPLAGNATLNASANFGGRYVANGNLKIVEDDQNVNDTNKQSTRAYSPTVGVEVTVADGDQVPGQGTDVYCKDTTCPTFWSEWSHVTVNQGQPIAADTLYQFQLTFDGSLVPGGVNSGNVKIYHSWTDGTGDHSELISTACTLKAGVPTNAPCLTPNKLPGNDLQVTIWSFHNGYIRGGF
jgi:hypothetical protein